MKTEIEYYHCGPEEAMETFKDEHPQYDPNKRYIAEYELADPVIWSRTIIYEVRNSYAQDK